MSILAILLIIAILGVAVWALTLLPMPQPFKNLLIAVAVILVLVWVISQVGGVNLGI